MVDVLGAIGAGLVVPHGFHLRRLNVGVMPAGVLAVYRDGGGKDWRWSCWLDFAGRVGALQGCRVMADPTLSEKFCLDDPDLYSCLQVSLDGACDG